MKEEMPVDSQLHSAALLAALQYAVAIEPIVQRHFSFKPGGPQMVPAPDWRASLSFILRTPHDHTIQDSRLPPQSLRRLQLRPSRSSHGIQVGHGPCLCRRKNVGITIAPGEKNHEAMMKNAVKVPDNTVFFMNNGKLYSASGMLDPTGNFYIP
jgi:hypothetical protein